MFPLLLSVLSGVRELSATASLAEAHKPDVSFELPNLPGVSAKDFVASLCPIAVAFIVATIRYYNEKQIQRRTSDPQVHPNPLLTFGDVNIVQHSNCGDIGAVLERRRSERFYISDNSIVTFKVRSTSLTLIGANTGILTRRSQMQGRRGTVPCPQTLLPLRTQRSCGYVRHVSSAIRRGGWEGRVGRHH